MDEAMVEGIARGYAVANLWTAGIDEMSGEYQPDEDKVEALMPYAREAAAAFGHIAAMPLANCDMDLERIGQCLHYEREGHGTGFADEDGDSYWLGRMEAIARNMGEDYQMQSELLDRWPSEAFAG